MSINAVGKLWAHLVFINFACQRFRKSVYRSPRIVFGLFNQIYALFAAVDLAKALGRQQLVISDFYVNYNNKNFHVPLSKIVNLQTLLIPTVDWVEMEEPNLLHYVNNHNIAILQKESAKPDIEVNCCFMMSSLIGHCRQQHVRQMRFHPILYEIIGPFLEQYPAFQVVHYRLENDFSSKFCKRFRFKSNNEFRSHLHQQYHEALTTHLVPDLPTLVVSHYYKDVSQNRDYDLQWGNLIHFQLSSLQRELLCNHLGLPINTPIREVNAVLDFILCTSANVVSFIGCGGSTFSEAVYLYHDHNRTFSFLISPHQPNHLKT